MCELKSKILDIKKRDKELNFRSNKVKEYLDLFVDITEKEYAEMKKKIEELGISRLKERHIVKILDIMPQDIDSLKSLFAGESVSIKQEDLIKVLNIIK